MTEEPIALDLEKIAAQIERLSSLGAEIKQSRLQERLIVTLLHEMSGVGKRDIQFVLRNLPLLAQQYLKPVRKA